MKSSKQNFIASVKDEYLDSIDNVAQELRKKGCDIISVMKISGVITGRITDNIDLKKLKIVKGIASIEKERKLKKM